MTRPFEDYPKGARALIVTAERLFGQHGLDGVSLRQIVVAAGQANTSAVHHHFGSREGLIQAVHDMRVPAMEKARQERLAEIDRAGRTDLEALLGALLLPIIEVLPPDERRSFAKFMLSLLTLDDAEHPFLRSIEQSPATFELNRRIAALFSALPPDVFNMRLRAAISLFLNAIAAERRVRSEEHTSELQSLMRSSYAVFCWKKKK